MLYQYDIPRSASFVTVDTVTHSASVRFVDLLRYVCTRGRDGFTVNDSCVWIAVKVVPHSPTRDVVNLLYLIK